MDRKLPRRAMYGGFGGGLSALWTHEIGPMSKNMKYVSIRSLVTSFFTPLRSIC